MTKKILMYIRENIKEIIIYTSIYFAAIVLGVLLFNILPIGREYENTILTTLDSAKLDNYAGINIIANGIKHNVLFLLIAIFAMFTYICNVILSSIFVVKGISTGLFISSIYSILGPIRGTEFAFLDIVVPQVFCIFGLILFATLVKNAKSLSDIEPLNMASIAVFSLSLLSFSIVFEQLISSVCINIYTNIN